MKANYHTHTWRCNHADGTEEAYIEAAIGRNLSILGFSDHTPYFFPGEYYSKFRMRPELLSDYVQTLEALRKSYRGQIELLIGLEAEYYPGYFGTLLPYLQDHGIEYLILGQHFVADEPFNPYSGIITADPDILKTYCRSVRDGMQTGLFTYFAHPDLFQFVGDEKIYRQEVAGLIREAIQCRVPLEVNLLGIREGRHYPSVKFWELAAEENCPVILGMDAHSVSAIENTAAEQDALAMIEQLGLPLLETAQIHKIN